MIALPGEIVYTCLRVIRLALNMFITFPSTLSTYKRRHQESSRRANNVTDPWKVWVRSYGKPGREHDSDRNGIQSARRRGG